MIWLYSNISRGSDLYTVNIKSGVHKIELENTLVSDNVSKINQNFAFDFILNKIMC